MSKERMGEHTHIAIKKDEYKKLKEQAERVQELENQVENWQKGRYLAVSTIDKERELKKRVQELEELLGAYMTEVRILKNANKRIKKQNKRYREALEFYADKENYKPFDGIFLSNYQNKVDEDGGEVAQKALKGE